MELLYLDITKDLGFFDFEDMLFIYFFKIFLLMIYVKFRYLGSNSIILFILLKRTFLRI